MTEKIISSFKGMSGKIGILGGTFDPVQFAHLKIAELAREKLDLDTVVFIPAEQNPLKSQSNTSSLDRLNMLQIALRNKKSLFVSDIELNEVGPSYTIDTIKNIKGQLSNDAQLFFILGSDCLVDLHKWKHFQELLTIVEIVLVARENNLTVEKIDNRLSGFTVEEKKIIRKNYINYKHIEISSSKVRKRIKADESIDDLLPVEVIEYIKENNLYQ